jgi:hypothetical protein
MVAATAIEWEPKANTTSNWRQVSMRPHLTAESLCSSVPDPADGLHLDLLIWIHCFFVSDLNPIFQNVGNYHIKAIP